MIEDLTELVCRLWEQLVHILTHKGISSETVILCLILVVGGGLAFGKTNWAGWWEGIVIAGVIIAGLFLCAWC